MRHLGALGFLLFWMLAASGIYLYVRFDTSATLAYTSIGELEWWFGGVLRSLHRYAADAFVVVTIAHLIRELWLGRFRGWRAFTWISGVPLVWLLYASGLIGYWLVWDTRSQFSFLATLEWTGLAAGAGEAPDRLFSLFVFLHIGLPLALLAGMWVHVQRLGQPATVMPRKLALGALGLLLTLALVLPVKSELPWDPGAVPQTVAIDWYMHFLHPLMYATSPAALWALVLGTTLLLAALPWLTRRQRLPAAVVNLENCNGCGRCIADCPYEAVTRRPDKRAVVLADRCAACGICAGACPSATPFRSVVELVSGIDLPDFTVHDLRRQLQAALETRPQNVVFRCEHAAQTAAGGEISLRCLAMLPPSFVEYALRRGARRVQAVGCPEGACKWRLGMDLCAERFAGTREPHLRANVRAEMQDDAYTFALR